MPTDQAFDVLCCGNLNYDITFHAERLPDAHEKLVCENLHLGFGGSAANTAWRLVGLGLRVAAAGNAGDDELSRAHIASLARRGIDTSAIEIQPGTGGIAVQLALGNEKRVIKASGANAQRQAPLAAFAMARHIHCSSGAQEIIAAALDYKDEHPGTSVSWDPGAVIYQELLPRVSMLAMNEDELRRMKGEDDILGAVMSLPCELVGLGLNGGGAIFKRGAEMLRVKSPGIVPLDLMGAGDSFTAAMIYAQLQQLDLATTARLAVAAACEAAMHEGARGGDYDAARLHAFAESLLVEVV